MSEVARFSAADHRHMARAIALAWRGLYTTEPNPRVGCVLVQGDEVVGEGWHRYAGGPHAEVEALRQAGARARGAHAYVTLEPCNHHGRTGPCSEALLEAGVAAVTVAGRDSHPQAAGGLERLREAGVAVRSGLMEAEAEALNPGFFQRLRHARPYVRIKLAASLDGRTAMASGESRWVTGAAAREDVHRLRARSSAIVTGVGTVLADDPALTVRLADDPTAGRQPLRVVCDSRLRTPVTARLLREPGQSLLVAAACGSEAVSGVALREAGAEVLFLPGRGGRIAPDHLLAELAGRGCNEVLVEAGPTLAGSFVAAGLVDELVLYLAPHLMGSAARGLFELPGLAQMAQRIALELDDLRQVGDDLRITARLKGEG